MKRLMILLSVIVFQIGIVLPARAADAPADDVPALWKLDISTDPIDDKRWHAELSLSRKLPRLQPSWFNTLLKIPLGRHEYLTLQCFPSSPDEMHLYFHQSHCDESGKNQIVDAVFRVDNNAPIHLKAVFQAGGILNNRCNITIPFFSAIPKDLAQKGEIEPGRANEPQYRSVVGELRSAQHRVVLRVFPEKRSFTIVMPLMPSPTIAKQFDDLHETCKLNLVTVPFDEQALPVVPNPVPAPAPVSQEGPQDTPTAGTTSAPKPTADQPRTP